MGASWVSLPCYLLALKGHVSRIFLFSWPAQLLRGVMGGAWALANLRMTEMAAYSWTSDRQGFG